MTTQYMVDIAKQPERAIAEALSIGDRIATVFERMLEREETEYGYTTKYTEGLEKRLDDLAKKYPHIFEREEAEEEESNDNDVPTKTS